MKSDAILSRVLADIPSPSFVLDIAQLQANARLLNHFKSDAGITLLFALKAFSNWKTFPFVSSYFDGSTASSIHEAELGAECFGGETHIFSPAFQADMLDDVARLTDHVVFNSISQLDAFGPKLKALKPNISIGLRINPGVSVVKTALYDPCQPSSRLGVPLAWVTPDVLAKIDGLHSHNCCESGAEPLEKTIQKVVSHFGDALQALKWLNFGGGHFITHPDYDQQRAIKALQWCKKETGLNVYLEPGAALALDAGVLVASVVDIIPTQKPNVILDISATAHMPDVLEMPYRPTIDGAGQPDELSYTYRLGGVTCLAGDYIGDYSFSEPLRIGQKLVFRDMAQYTMVKTTTFNGVQHPHIAHLTENGVEVVRRFSYADFKSRLG